MTYKILSIERIDPKTLPKAMMDGFARWKAVVEFWDGPAEGSAQLTDLFILDRATQHALASGDDWSLMTKEDTLAETIVELVEKQEPLYLQMIRDGKSGYIGDVDPEIHGKVKSNDSICSNSKVTSLINVVKEKAK